MEINWDRIRDIDDVIVPAPFGTTEGEWLGHITHGSRVIDRDGNRFLVMGYGPVQGSVILRDRYRRMFCADIDQRLKVTR